MAWDDTPPDVASSWDSAPPAPEDLGSSTPAPASETPTGFPEPQTSDNPPAGAEKPFEQKVAENIQTVGAGAALPSAIEGIYGLAKGAGKLLARGAGKALPENLVETVGRTADNQMLKSTGASMGQIRQIGPEAAREAAHVGREAGLGDVFGTEIGREKALANLDKTTGKAIGQFREAAGPAGASTPAELPTVPSGTKTGAPHALFAYNDNFGPEGAPRSVYNIFGDPESAVFKEHGWGSSLPAEEIEKSGIPIVGRQAGSEKFVPLAKEAGPSILQNAIDKVSPKYASGVHSGEQGALDKAIETARKTLGDNPTHADYARAATALNKFATANKIYQPTTAATDLANNMSRENDAQIAQVLGSDKAAAYLKSLSDEQAYKTLKPFFERGELREMAGRGGVRGIVQQVIQSLANKGGYRATAKLMNALHQAMTEPAELGTLGKSAAMAGKTIPLEIQKYVSQSGMFKGGPVPDDVRKYAGC